MGEEAGFHKYEFRHEDDNKLLAFGDTLFEVIKNIYWAVDEESIGKGNLYGARVFVATGPDINNLLDWIESV